MTARSIPPAVALSWVSARRWTCVVCFAAGMHAQVAVADRYEATLSVRPVGAMARITEDVSVDERSAVVASTRGGGGEVGLAWGLRNWLDLEGDLVAAGFTQVMYDPATVAVTGSVATGRLIRTTRIIQLRAGATLRLGVAWVPTVHLGLGIGGRALTAAALHDEEHGRTVDITPDGMDAGFPIDVIAIVRVGFEHRFDQHWSAGVAAEAAHAIGIGTPPLDLVAASISLSYTWYPGWW